MRDRIQVQEVAKEHRGEERVLGTEARGHEVGQRGARRLAGLVQVAGVARGAVQQRAGAHHGSLVVAPDRAVDGSAAADVIGVEAAGLKQAAAHPRIGHFGEAQVFRLLGHEIELQRELCCRSGADGVPVRVFEVVGEGDASRARELGVCLPAGHLERHDPFRRAEHFAAMRELVDAHQLDSHPVVVVVVLGAAGPHGRGHGAVIGGERAREGAFRGARVVEVEIGAKPHQARVQFLAVGAVHAQDVGHADGGRQRLREGPQVGERFAAVQARAGDVVETLHGGEGALRTQGISVQARLAWPRRLLRLGRGGAGALSGMQRF